MSAKWWHLFQRTATKIKWRMAQEINAKPPNGSFWRYCQVILTPRGLCVCACVRAGRRSSHTQRLTPSPRSTTPAVQLNVAKCHACHAKWRSNVAKRHACHTKWRSMSPSATPATQQPRRPRRQTGSATPATQSAGRWRLPPKVKVDVTKPRLPHQ